MKFMKLFVLCITAVSITALAGCGVPKDKYESALKDKAALEEKVSVLNISKDALKKEYENLTKENMELTAKVETLTNEKAALKSEYDKILDEKVVLKAAYDKLQAAGKSS